jgi:hypothetical protein
MYYVGNYLLVSTSKYQLAFLAETNKKGIDSPQATAR